MDTPHPAIDAYARLRKQTDDIVRLHFALLQQLWLEARGDAREKPSDYSMMLLRAMSAAFLTSEGRSELQIRATLIDVMGAFERDYVRLFATELERKSDAPDAEAMRRTRWPNGSNVVSILSSSKRRELPDD